MKIVIAPNAFKGTLSARETAAAIRRGLARSLPRAELLELPVADGGDGTADVLAGVLHGKIARRRVTGPLGKTVNAQYVKFERGGSLTFILEVAQTSGLALIPERFRNPMKTTTQGLGELIAFAREAGATEIFIGLGGSGTVDGGAGMARALGFKLLDSRGKPISSGGGGLESLDRIIPPESKVANKGTLPKFTGLCDVTNRLLGPRGAPATFGPQKGATPSMVRHLEKGLSRLARCLERDLGRPVRKLTGGGAAGGLGAGLAGFLGGELRPGAELILELIGFREALRGADWVVTGEGPLDTQTLDGKAPAVVARFAGEAGVPVIALAGEVSAEFQRENVRRTMGLFRAMFPIDRAPGAPKSRTQTARNLEAAAREIGELIR